MLRREHFQIKDKYVNNIRISSNEQRIREAREAHAQLIEDAEQGDAVAQNVMGNSALDSRDYPEALKWFRLSAEGGCAASCNALARMYEEGNGVENNEIEMIYWYIRSAKLGNEHGLSKSILNLRWMSEQFEFKLSKMK